MKVLIMCLFLLCGLSNYVESVVVVCDFNNSNNGYMCDVKYLKITTKENRTITGVIGDHLSGKSNSDVKFIKSENHIVKFFPLELARLFEYLEIVQINNAALFEIHSSDFQQFGGNLKKLSMDNNAIQVLEADLFQYNANLNYISLSSNKLRHVDDETFRGIEELTALYLRHNPCIDNYEQSRDNVIALISQAELSCKDYTYMLKKYQEATQAQLDAMSAKILQCQCSS